MDYKTLHEVLSRAQGFSPGSVLPEELSAVRCLLRDGSGDIYAAIYVVGLCGSEQDAVLIEPYLSDDYPDYVRSAALVALCRYLALSANYRAVLADLVFSEETDDTVDERHTAIQLCGDHLSAQDDPEIGCRLVEICRNSTEGVWIRTSALRSLAGALKMEDELDRVASIEEQPTSTVEKVLIAATKRFQCDESICGGRSGRSLH